MIPHNGLSATRATDPQRRRFVVLAGLGVISFRPTTAFAAATTNIPEDAFKQKDEREASNCFMADRRAVGQGQARRPEIAENGAVVPVAVTTTLTEVTSVSFWFRKIECAGGVLQESRQARSERGQSPQNGETSRVIVIVEAAASFIARPRKSR